MRFIGRKSLGRVWTQFLCMNELEDIGLKVSTPRFSGDWVGASHWIEGVDVSEVLNPIGIG